MRDRIVLILLHIGAILAVALFLYLPICENDFVYDDGTNVAENAALADPRFADYLFSPQYAPSISGPDYYSPMALLSYMLDARLYLSPRTGQLSAVGVHATNLVLYLAVCLLAYGCLLSITRRPGLAVLAAVFFVVHPMHSENANYVSSRPETLGALFVLLTLLLSEIETKALWSRVVQFFAVGLGALFALLSAASGLALPFLMAAADWARHRPRAEGRERRRIRWLGGYAPVGVAFVLFVALRLAIFGSLMSVRTFHPFFENLSPWGLAMAWFQTLLRYVSLAVFPYPSTAIYNPLEAGSKAFLAGGLVSAGILVAMGGALALAARRVPWLGLGAAWFFWAIFPNLPFRPAFQVIVESKLLLPSMGACLAAGAVIFALADSRQPLLEGARNTAVAVLTSLALTSLAALSYSRGLDWKSGPDLWRAERLHHPKEETVLSSVAYYQAREGNYEEAEKSLRKALECYSMRPSIFCELAVNNIRLGKKDEALHMLDCGLAETKVRQSSFFVQLGSLYEQLGQLDKAVQAYQLAVSRDPGDWASRFLLGNTELTQRDFQKAIDEYSKALETAPPNQRAAVLVNRAIARRKIGDVDGSIQDAEEGIKFDPFEPRLRIELSNGWLSKSSDPALRGKDDEKSKEAQRLCLTNAIKALQEAVRQVAPNVDLYLSLADLQRTSGYPEQASYWATRCRQAFPNDPKARLYEATFLMSLNRFDEAGRLFTAMMADPVLRSDPRAVAGLGYCLFQKGAYPQAKERCEASLRLNRANPVGLLLYRLLTEKGIPMDPDLVRGLPPTIIMPRGPLQPEYTAPEAPMELPARGPMP